MNLKIAPASCQKIRHKGQEINTGRARRPPNRDDYFDNQSEMRDIAEIIVSQNKSGNRGVVRLVWLPEYLRFSSIDDTDININYVYKNGKTYKRCQLKERELVRE